MYRMCIRARECVNIYIILYYIILYYIILYYIILYYIILYYIILYYIILYYIILYYIILYYIILYYIILYIGEQRALAFTREQYDLAEAMTHTVSMSMSCSSP